jgi:hypothetical protein
MAWRFLGLFALAGVMAASHCSAPSLRAQKNLGPKPAVRVTFSKDVAPLLARYCAMCHGGKRPKGDLSLDRFTDDAAAKKHPEIWEKVAQNLRSGDMPPKGKPRPTGAELAVITAWIDRETARVDCTKPSDPGRVTIRRLNRVEYRNTVRDLLGVDYKPADDFPSDDVGYGFDNIGDVLSLSPLLLERYLDAAERIVDLAFKDPKIRERILAPSKGKKAEVVRSTIERLARRAYRRPVTADEVARLARFVDLAEGSGQNLNQGLQLALKAMLVSPHFLFRVEVDHVTKPGAIYPINDFELASRLSYFLWSSMPDDELFRVAGMGGLRKDLDTQVRRMVRDPRAGALTANFAGQWLQLRSLKDVSPDPKTFPSFSPQLRDAMRRETELFFETVVKEDRSILDFLDGDFTFVNETLARHYGIAGVKGNDFQRVKLSGDTARGGVLTHASILTVTSNPTRTSPVKRGKWILENILGTPPPPPPPDAGELPDDKSELKGTLRQRMEMHRSKAICASCHQRMDPLGFALENFDGIGAWRTRDGRFPVDAGGTLPDGQSFEGAKGLRGVLKARAADFRRCLAEKMLTYALGRGLEFYDKCAVDKICAAMTRNGDRFSSMVVAIVNSEPFLLRKGRTGGKR